MTAREQELIDPDTCPKCENPTNKFIGECDQCGFDRWKDG